MAAGLSFEGSSGSPVIFLEKGMPGYTVDNREYIAPRIIGVMSGHITFGKEPPKSDLLTPHSGLSYFTKSTTILEILSKNNSQKIDNYIAENEQIEEYQNLAANNRAV